MIYIWLASSVWFFLDAIEDNPDDCAGGMGYNPTVPDGSLKFLPTFPIQRRGHPLFDANTMPVGNLLLMVISLHPFLSRWHTPSLGTTDDCFSLLNFLIPEHS